MFAGNDFSMVCYVIRITITRHIYLELIVLGAKAASKLASYEDIYPAKVVKRKVIEGNKSNCRNNGLMMIYYTRVLSL